MRRRILILTALHVGVAALLGGVAWGAGVLGTPPLVALLFAVVIALVGSLQMNVELGRHACWVTMTEAVVVVMLVHLSPGGVVVAAVLGEVLACAWQRQSPLKLLYNAAGVATATMVAVLLFELLRAGGTAEGATWVAALVAGCSYATATHAATSAVLAVVEDRRFTHVFTASLLPVSVASLISTTIGLVAVVLHGVTPVAVLLVAPLVLVMVAETRRLAIQRAEQLRFERLYAASSRTGVLTGLPEVMAKVAGEARSLVTGASAVCCTVDLDGDWWGVVVGEDGVVPVPPAAVDELLGLAGEGAAVELDGPRLPAEVVALLPFAASLVVARADAASAAPVLLAVLRELAGDDRSSGRTEVLAAFMGHAALTVANARLYADVESALAHQVDLNRQKDDFVSAVSHELRTPLAAMIGSVLTLRRMDDRLAPEQRAKLVDVSYRQGKRLQRLIEELLTLATVENGEAPTADEPIDLERMIEDITDDLRTQRAGKELPPIRFEDAGIGTIRSAEQKLRQVVSNLVENACKYADGSPIEVRLEAGDPGTVCLKVLDGGRGIPPADRERVFERFVQLDQTSTRSQGGTGLGLYLCRQVAILLGGMLTLDEAPGGGCCFTLTLPRAADAETGDERRPLPDFQLTGATTAGGRG